MDKLYQRC